MTRHGLEAPDVLTGGSWRTDEKAVLRWLNDAQPDVRTRDDLHLLIACPTCHAKVDETCLRGTRTDGYRGRGSPHKSRLAPRLCRCGAGLRWKRKLCDACRDAENRTNKRDYMRRARAAEERQNPTVDRDSRKMGATEKRPPAVRQHRTPGASPTKQESTDGR